VLVYGPLAHGLLSGHLTETNEFGPGDWRATSDVFHGDSYRTNLAVVAELQRLVGELALRLLLCHSGPHQRGQGERCRCPGHKKHCDCRGVPEPQGLLPVNLPARLLRSRPRDANSPARGGRFYTTIVPRPPAIEHPRKGMLRSRTLIGRGPVDVVRSRSQRLGFSVACEDA
jgi:hypothetical protein